MGPLAAFMDNLTAFVDNLTVCRPILHLVIVGVGRKKSHFMGPLAAFMDNLAALMDNQVCRPRGRSFFLEGSLKKTYIIGFYFFLHILQIVRYEIVDGFSVRLLYSRGLKDVIAFLERPHSP